MLPRFRSTVVEWCRSVRCGGVRRPFSMNYELQSEYINAAAYQRHCCPPLLRESRDDKSNSYLPGEVNKRFGTTVWGRSGKLFLVTIQCCEYRGGYLHPFIMTQLTAHSSQLLFSSAVLCFTSPRFGTSRREHTWNDTARVCRSSLPWTLE